MNTEALEQRYQILVSDFQAGRINAAAFAAEVDKLSFQDQGGHYWMMGMQSGSWYYYDGQNWRLADPRQPTPPSLPLPTPPQAGPRQRPQEGLPAKALLMV